MFASEKTRSRKAMNSVEEGKCGGVRSSIQSDLESLIVIRSVDGRPVARMESEEGRGQEDLRFEDMYSSKEDSQMRRVDPDCVDEVFAQFHRDPTTSTIPLDKLRIPSETTEDDLLIGVEALVDFVQAAQKGSAPIEKPSTTKSPSKRS